MMWIPTEQEKFGVGKFSLRDLFIFFNRGVKVRVSSERSEFSEYVQLFSCLSLEKKVKRHS